MTIEKKNKYFVVKDANNQIVYKGKDEEKANIIYKYRQQLEVKNQTLNEKVNFGFRFY